MWKEGSPNVNNQQGTDKASCQQPNEQVILQADPPTPGKLQRLWPQLNILTQLHGRPQARTTQLSCSQIPMPQEPCEIKYVCS